MVLLTPSSHRTIVPIPSVDLLTKSSFFRMLVTSYPLKNGRELECVLFLADKYVPDKIPDGTGRSLPLRNVGILFYRESPVRNSCFLAIFICVYIYVYE